MATFGNNAANSLSLSLLNNFWKRINVSIYTLIYWRLRFELTSTLIIPVTTSELDFSFIACLPACLPDIFLLSGGLSHPNSTHSLSLSFALILPFFYTSPSLPLSLSLFLSFSYMYAYKFRTELII